MKSTTNIQEFKLTTFRKLRAKFKDLPPIKTYWYGIPEFSIGFIFGPAKSGKTTFCESLALSIAAMRKEFMNKPLIGLKRKVLFISHEENPRPRSDRNTLQLKEFTFKERKIIDKNLFTAIGVPNMLSDQTDWKSFLDLIKRSKCQLVFVDSFNCLSYEQEKADKAKAVMKRLKAFVENEKITMIIVHHPIKMEGPISVNKMAGSAALQRDVDFIYAINCTDNGYRYYKHILNRNMPCEQEEACLFEIDSTRFTRFLETKNEHSLFEENLKSEVLSNKDKVYEYFKEHPDEELASSTLKEVFVPIFSYKTLTNQLKTLQEESKVVKLRTSVYKLK